MDDLGWADLSCYGSKFYETPNLDRLAASACQIHERVCRLSGLFANARQHYDGQVSGSCRDNQLPAGQASASVFKAPASGAEAVPGLEEDTIPEVLKPLGYRFGAYRQMASRTYSRILAGEARLRRQRRRDEQRNAEELLLSAMEGQSAH